MEAIFMSNSITYRRVGDYMIPNLILPPEEAKVRLGKWGMMDKGYFQITILHYQIHPR